MVPGPISAARLAAFEAPAQPAPAAVRGAAPVPPAAWLPSPYISFDSALNLVVLEFHDRLGRITHSIPSADALAAYRLHGLPRGPGASGGQ